MRKLFLLAIIATTAYYPTLSFADNPCNGGTCVNHMNMILSCPIEGGPEKPTTPPAEGKFWSCYCDCSSGPASNNWKQKDNPKVSTSTQEERGEVLMYEDPIESFLK